MSRNPYLAGLLLAAGVVGCMLVLSVYQRLCSPHPERVRKLMHVGGGLLALPLPLLCSETGPALLACGLIVLLLAAIRILPHLKQGIGTVLGSAGRRSRGDLWFPVSVAFLFVASRGDLLLYSIPLLILTFADAAAALVGLHWGKTRPSHAQGAKTVEGSLAFFIVAFLAAAIPLTFFPAKAGTPTMLIALLLAVVLSVVEGACGDGLDNLVVPVAGFYLLGWLLTLSAGQLALCLGSALVSTAALLGRGARAWTAMQAADGAPDAT